MFYNNNNNNNTSIDINCRTSVNIDNNRNNDISDEDSHIETEMPKKIKFNFLEEITNENNFEFAV